MDDIGRHANEIRDGVNAELNARLLTTVARTVAAHVQQYRTPELENLREALQRCGLKVPFLGCEGITRYGEDCTLIMCHEGECQ